MRYTSVLFLLALTGCPAAGDDKGDTAGTTGDTGDTDVTYEEGCITVDGGGGYAKLADAVTVAPDGGVIELCAGTYDEAVTIEKSVTILGGGATLTGPGSDVPLIIAGPNVTVQDLVVESPRTGIKLDGATDVALSGVTIAAAGSWGLTAKDATGTIDGLTITEPGAGGVQASGGSLAFTDLAIDYPASFGLELSDDADVTLTNATITGTLMVSDDVSDGYAVTIDGATLTMVDSAIVGAEGIGIYGVDAGVTLTGTTIRDAIYLGVFAFDSTYDFDGVDITGSYLQGVYLDGPSVSLANTTVSTVTGTSCELTYDEWGADGNPWCGAINIAGDTVTLSGVTASGYENYGIIVQPNDEDVATLAVTDTTIDDVGRWGAYFVYAEGTVSGLTVTNLREPELTSDLICGYVDRSAAVLGVYADLDIDGMVLRDNMGWGFTNLLGDATITGSTFDGNHCWGYANYQSTATVSGSTFTNGSQNGSIYEQEGVLVLDGNTFTANKTGAVYEYDYGTYVSRSEYSGGQGTDLTAYSSGAVYVTGNTFTSGDASLVLQNVAEAEVSGNSWTDYEGTLAYFYATTGTARFANNTADDVVGPVAQSSYGPLEVANVTVGTTRASDLIEYAYYEDDALIYNYSYSSSNPVFYASGYYYDDGAGTITDMPGSLAVEDVTVTSAYSGVVYAYDAEIEVNGLEVGETGGNLVYGYWDSYGPDAEVSGLTAGTSDAGAFYFT
ncbi:MAG: right-handed parallel beta-helix repeat-containing protein, partial [Myxococcota bacterium]